MRSVSKPRLTPRLLIFLMVFIGVGFTPAAAQEAISTQEAEKVVTITFGYPAGIFAGVNAQDAKAATKVWGDRMLHKQGFRYVSDVIIYSDLETMIREIKNGHLQMFTVNSFDYLMHADDFGATPVAASVTNDSNSMKYQVIVRKDSGIANLAGLKGRAMIIAPVDAGIVPEAWLNVQLAQAGLSFADQHLGSIRAVAKPNRAVLPVFFKQSDACLVRKDSFEVLAELNPQISQQLTVIAESPFYLNGLLCFSNQYDVNDRNRMVDKLIEMDRIPEGQQILNLFRVDKCIPFKPELLDSVRQLHTDYEEATRRAGRRPATFFLNPAEQ